MNRSTAILLRRYASICLLPQSQGNIDSNKELDQKLMMMGIKNKTPDKVEKNQRQIYKSLKRRYLQVPKPKRAYFKREMLNSLRNLE